MRNLIKFLFLSFILICSFSCNSLKTAPYDQYSYQKTIEIKVQSTNLIKKSISDYSEHVQEVNDLNNQLDLIKEYESHRPNNQITIAMWDLMTDDHKNLLSGYLLNWKKKSQNNQSLSPAFVLESLNQINQAFDKLIQYELAKDKKTETSLLNYINNN